MTKQDTGPLHRRNDPHNLPLEEAREMFLQAYEKCQPAVLGELAQAPLEAFREEGAGRTEDLWDKIRFSPRFPRLTRSLEVWAGKFYFHSAGEPAQWVMATALTTLSWWSASTGVPQKRRWHFPLHLQQEYLGAEPGLRSVGRGLADTDLGAIQIEIPNWDLRSGESKRDFRRRANESCKRAIEEHIGQIESQGWTRRQKLATVEYIDGFALWQCGSSLEQIRRRLQEKGLHVGNKSDHTGIVHGIKAVADYIGLDRRPRKRSTSS